MTMPQELVEQEVASVHNYLRGLPEHVIDEHLNSRRQLAQPYDDEINNPSHSNLYDNTFKQVIPTIKSMAESKIKLSFGINNITQKIAETEKRITEKRFPTPLLNSFKNSPVELQEKLIITILQDQLSRYRIKKAHLEQTKANLVDIITTIKTQIDTSIHDQTLKTHQLFIIDQLSAKIQQFYNDHCMALSLDFQHRMTQHSAKKEKKRLQASSNMDFHQPTDIERKVKKLEQQLQSLKKSSNKKTGRPSRSNGNNKTVPQKKKTTT